MTTGDIEKLNVDVIAFTGHKSLLGPTGIGGLYIKESVTIKHTRAGGTGVKSAQRHHLEEYPYRLEYGTLNTVGIAGLYAGLNWVCKKGVENIHRHEMNLTRQLRDGLNGINNVITYCADDLTNHIGILSFNIKGFTGKAESTLESCSLYVNNFSEKAFKFERYSSFNLISSSFVSISDFFS